MIKTMSLEGWIVTNVVFPVTDSLFKWLTKQGVFG